MNIKETLKNYRFTITLKKSNKIIVGVTKAPDIPSVKDYVYMIGFSTSTNAKDISVSSLA